MDYEVIKEVINFREVASYFNEDNGESFLLCSTGGWHGTHRSLNDCERILKGKDEIWAPGGASITVLIINPSKVTIRWGEIRITKQNEIEWLRKKTRETLEKLNIEQEENK